MTTESSCPRCGAALDEGANFCGHCGLALVAHPSPLPPGVSSLALRERIAELTAERTNTDEILSPLWALLPLIAVVFGTFIGILLIFTPSVEISLLIFMVGSIVALALLIILNYKLVDRYNKHLVREASLRRTMIEYTWTRGQERGTTDAIYPYVSALESIDRQALMDEQPRSPLWSLAFLIPIVGVVLYFYMLYFLTRFASVHDDRWHAFAYNIHLSSMVNGDMVPPPLPKYPQERSFILYLLLTIIFSPFLFYWYFKLVDDPNKHFQEMGAFEDGFLTATGRALTGL